MQGEKPLTLSGFIEFLRDLDISKCCNLSGGPSIAKDNEVIVVELDQRNYSPTGDTPNSECRADSGLVVNTDKKTTISL